MGHTTVPDQNNALYGFKTDLREMLRNRRLPRWLKDSPIHAGSCRRDISVEEAFEIGAQRARKHREKFDTDDPTFTIEFVFDTNSRVVTRAGHRDIPVPDKIWEKLNITKQDGQEYTGRHDAHPGEYRLAVEVGPREGINDLQIVRDFRH
jgi:hypothetical protein